MTSPTVFRRLDPKTLQLFVAICEEGTLTRAAQRSAIAPSAVSKRLAELERALGVPLLIRQARGMAVTPAGESLLHHARRMLFNAEQIAHELAEHAKGVRGIVRMLANLSAIVEFLPEDLQSFLAEQGAIRIDLEERPSTGVVKGVEEGWAELGICAGSVPTRGLRRHHYRSDHLVVVMRPDHALSDRTHLAFAETLDFDFVGLHAESSIYASVRSEARRAGRSLRLRVHVPGFDAVCRMAQANMGLGVVPHRVFELLGPGMNLVAVRLTDGWAQRDLQIVTRDPPLSPAAMLLLSQLQCSGSKP